MTAEEQAALRLAATRLALRLLQSTLYQTDPEVQQLVDDILLVGNWREALHLMLTEEPKKGGVA